MARSGVQSFAASADEVEVVARLRAGDELAFDALVARHYATMLAVAQTYVKTRAVAEEVVQEAWLGVLQSLGRFQGRSSLKTWILAILIHKGEDPRDARGPDRPVRIPRARSRRAGGGPNALPRPARCVPGPLALLPQPLGRLGRHRRRGSRNAARHDARDCRAAACPTNRDPHARRSGLQLGRG